MSETQSPLIAELVCETRQHHGLAQEDAAKLESYQRLSHWENGRTSLYQ